MMVQYLKLQLLVDSGISLAGVALPGGELLYAKLRFLVADGDGFRIALDWKGFNSMHPCFKHCNVFKKGANLSHNMSIDNVEISCVDHARFKPATAKSHVRHMQLVM